MDGRVTIYDNGGRSFDRYTVFLHDHGYTLGIGGTGNVPNGFCMTVDAIEGDHLGRIISLDDMTPAARLAVIRELSWADQHCACGREFRSDGSCSDGGAWCG